MDERLTTDELIREARVPASFVDRLLAAGAISRDGDGLHAVGRSVSVRLAYALAEGGVDRGSTGPSS